MNCSLSISTQQILFDELNANLENENRISNSESKINFNASSTITTVTWAWVVVVDEWCRIFPNYSLFFSLACFFWSENIKWTFIYTNKKEVSRPNWLIHLWAVVSTSSFSSTRTSCLNQVLDGAGFRIENIFYIILITIFVIVLV